MLLKQRELWILYLSMVFSILWPQVQAIRQMRLCFCSRAPEPPAFWPQMYTGGWKVNVVRKGETLCFNIINQTLFLNVCSSRIPLVSMVAQAWFWHRGCLGNRHKHLTGSVRQKTGKKQMVTCSPFCLLEISFVSCSIFQYMQVCKNWAFIKRLAKCGFLAKLLERLPRQGSRSAPLWVTFVLLGWVFWACGNLMGGWILLCQDTPVRRWSLAGILGWGRGEGWGPWHICDGRNISSRGVWRRGVGRGAADGRPGISRARGHTQVTSGARAPAVASMC